MIHQSVSISILLIASNFPVSMIQNVNGFNDLTSPSNDAAPLAETQQLASHETQRPNPMVERNQMMQVHCCCWYRVFFSPWYRLFVMYREYLKMLFIWLAVKLIFFLSKLFSLKPFFVGKRRSQITAGPTTNEFSKSDFTSTPQILSSIIHFLRFSF